MSQWVDAWVVVEKEDPFVSGGVPLMVLREEQAAFDLMAELVAIEATSFWYEPHPFGRPATLTRYDCMRNVAGSFEVIKTLVPAVDIPHGNT